MECRIINYAGGSIIIGCGSSPCRCDELDALFADAAIAELEAELGCSLSERNTNPSAQRDFWAARHNDWLD